MSCRKMRGLIAASVYGDLNPGEQQALEGHLASCPACRIEVEALVKLSARIPTQSAALDRDLVPVLRVRIHETQPQPLGWLGWRWAGLAAIGVVCVVFFGAIMQRSSFVQQPTEVKIASLPEITPVQKALAETARFVERRDYPNAYVTLKRAVEAYPNDASSGEAQLARANLAFSELHWYPEAYDDYELLAQRYPEVFRTNSESIARRDLLAEAREQDFASLHALDTARRNTGDTFAQLEQVVGRYPGTFVASAAAEDMARVVSEEVAPADGFHPHLLAMECARDRCANPIARRQLDLEIGNICRSEMDDPVRARQHYQEVVASGDTVLAQVARQSLADLELEMAH